MAAARCSASLNELHLNAQVVPFDHASVKYSRNATNRGDRSNYGPQHHDQDIYDPLNVSTLDDTDTVCCRVKMTPYSIRC
jgi:hypothetical protein